MKKENPRLWNSTLRALEENRNNCAVPVRSSVRVKHVSDGCQFHQFKIIISEKWLIIFFKSEQNILLPIHRPVLGEEEGGFVPGHPTVKPRLNGVNSKFHGWSSSGTWATHTLLRWHRATGGTAARKTTLNKENKKSQFFFLNWPINNMHSWMYSLCIYVFINRCCQFPYPVCSQWAYFRQNKGRTWTCEKKKSNKSRKMIRSPRILPYFFSIWHAVISHAFLIPHWERIILLKSNSGF